MTLETLQIFCDLVELQNFSRTAEKHGISQSAISQQLAQLELLYGTQLINRKKRPMAPTNSGRLFYQGCKDIIDRYDQLKSELNALSKPSARINIAAIFSIGMYTLQPHVKKFIEYELGAEGQKLVEEMGFYPVAGDYLKQNAKAGF